MPKLPDWQFDETETHRPIAPVFGDLLGWEPPGDWIFGICQGCKTEFRPALPKQYWCRKCRSRNQWRI